MLFPFYRRETEAKDSENPGESKPFPALFSLPRAGEDLQELTDEFPDGAMGDLLWLSPSSNIPPEAAGWG